MDLYYAINDLGILADTQWAIDRLGEEKILIIIEEMLEKIDENEAQAWRMHYGVGSKKASFRNIATSFTPPIKSYMARRWVTRAQALLKHPLRANLLLRALGREALPVPEEENVSRYDDVKSHSLSSVGLSTRLIRILQLGGVCTVPELLIRTDTDVRHRIHGMGDVTFSQIKDALRVNGLSLRQ